MTADCSLNVSVNGYDGRAVEWRENPDSTEWDAALARLGGHPLQSALWGDARREIDGIHDHRWMAVYKGVPVWLARFEERRLPALGCIAWVPKGPTGELPGNADFLLPALANRLRRFGATLVIADAWKNAPQNMPASENSTARPRTIWIDLSLGQDALWQNLDKQWRYGVRRAERLGVIVECTKSSNDVDEFFALCVNISQAKGFRLPASAALMKRLLKSEEGSLVEARLVVARHQGLLGAGAFLIRCGGSTHYFWGATHRTLAKQRVGEAVQWAAIKWALATNCHRYDLEGIDPRANPGVYEFKKKMGGSEVSLAGKHYYPLDSRGRVLAWLDARFR